MVEVCMKTLTLTRIIALIINLKFQMKEQEILLYRQSDRERILTFPTMEITAWQQIKDKSTINKIVSSTQQVQSLNKSLTRQSNTQSQLYKIRTLIITKDSNQLNNSSLMVQIFEIIIQCLFHLCKQWQESIHLSLRKVKIKIIIKMEDISLLRCQIMQIRLVTLCDQIIILILFILLNRSLMFKNHLSFKVIIIMLSTSLQLLFHFFFIQFYFVHDLRVLVICNLTAINWHYHQQDQNSREDESTKCLIAFICHYLFQIFLQNLKNYIKSQRLQLKIIYLFLLVKWRSTLYFNSQIIQIIRYLYTLIIYMTTKIADWLFDFSSPIYLVHPNFKFWEVNLTGKALNMRVGKLRGDTEDNVQSVNISYASNAAAKNKAVEKIQQKLTKGYVPKNAKKSTQMVPQKKQKDNKRTFIEPQKKRSKVFSGQYYEKGPEAVRLQVNDKRVKITRIDNGKQKYQIRSYKDYDQAVQFCLQQESWLFSEGYRANNSKFIYSFIDQEVNEDKESRDTKKTKKKQQQPSESKYLSITKMTDEAISHRSRNNSITKSDRSYGGNDDDNDYVSQKLGKPTSGPISVLLAETWDNDIDPKGWIMSQKLDGVRCFWTGTAMFSRNGNRFNFPKFFTKGWPKSQMDGELFIDRGKFSETLSAVRKNVPIDQQWEKVRYLVFDVPGLKTTFKQRLKAMQRVIKQVNSPYLKCHAHRVCQGYEDLFKQLDLVNKIEGEGLMLRDPQSMYQNRRSKSLLKVKTFYDDEAEVIGYKPGTGRCTGMVGALRVRNTHGVQFEVGSGMTDQIRRKPPKIGSKITYKYQQFNKDSGKPRFPTYMRTFDKI